VFKPNLSSLDEPNLTGTIVNELPNMI
jgi:hypothetical protein